MRTAEPYDGARERHVTTIESEYYAYMGFDPAAAREGLAHYVPFFAGLDPVVELACGRGEFLDVLRDAGGTGRGVDLDPGMVAAARSAGHDVEHADALTFLAECGGGSYGGVFAAHLVEHLEPDDVLALCRSARSALRPGGRLVLVTPNAASHSVMAYDFWRDPTHVRFYDAALLAFFCAQAGLVVEETGANPRNDPGPPPHLWPSLPPSGDAAVDDLRAAYERLLRELYPPSEVYVVARHA